MERLLRPERFDVEPSSKTASKEWRHWFKTFENFVLSLSEENRTSKFQLLTNLVAPNVYEFIADSSSYDDATQSLNMCMINLKVKFMHDICCQLGSRNCPNHLMSTYKL